jgi:hypothetical protein
MTKILVIAAIAAMGAAACATTPGGGGGGGGFASGCYDSSSSVLSVIYDGPIDSYKNARLAVNNTGCGSDPLDEWVTVVLAADEPSAVAACQSGPDPAVDGVANFAAIGFDTMPADAWFCGNPFSGDLLQPGDCYPIGTASVEYIGPRNTMYNAVLHTNDTTCTSTIVGVYTYVQHSSQAAALAACVSIDPTFTSANSLVVIPTIPNDSYLCLAP